ncbi:hypothetical protein DY023_09150 [Microbacterium bovistercoris]|uniref:Uncharacterized protein n=1 Tax=Microbacterium bovistercoris TaxID=2293570 RepID=A0A371NUK8_9MICO|nr:hypothetical protein [Microbacterium bovistercoris]REJ05415.1 hypothetical protein DY023_09150 [Microbacterium bovistercoris]
MAFTEQEFMRGALWAWLMFLILLPLMFATSLVPWSTDPKSAFGGFVWGLTIGGFALIFAAPVSLVVMALGTWPFRWVGRALQRVSSFAAHMLAYCALGVAFGIGAAFATACLSVPSGGVAVGFASGAAIPLGWAITARRALRDDRRPPSLRVDVDAAFEDRALDD